MPSEYEALVAALKLLETPIAEYGWKAKPEGNYYVIGLDFAAGSLDGDGMKLDRVWEGSLDLFFQKLSDRTDLIEETEETLAEILGNAWEMNSTQYEASTGYFHVEWVFQVQDVPAEEDDA